MTVARIVDRAFIMQVDDPKLATVLDKLNKGGDETLNLADFDFPVSGASEETKVRLMRELTVGAFAEAGYVKNEEQRRAMLGLFDLSERAKRFSDTANELTSVGKLVLERDGNLDLRLYEPNCNNYSWHPSIEGFGDLANDLASILYLTGTDVIKATLPQITLVDEDICVANYTTGFVYNENELHPSLREPVRDIVNRFNVGVALLFPYTSITCSHTNNLSGRRYFSRQPYIPYIEAGSENKILEKGLATGCGSST